MKKFIYIFLTLCAAVSCMTPFDLDYDDTPVIFLEAFPGADAEYIKFEIQPAYSKSNTAQKPPFNPEIIFEVDGNTVPVEYVEAEVGYYIAHHKPMPGEKMKISVTSEGFVGISAETVIPEAFPQRKIDYRKVESGLDKYSCVVYVTPESIDPKWCYGIQFLNEYSYVDMSGPVDRIYKYSGLMFPDNEGGYDELVPMSMSAMSLELYGSSLWAWDGDQLDSSSCTFSLIPISSWGSGIEAYESFFETSGERMQYDDEGNEVGVSEYVDHNKILLYTMTDEFYKYMVAKELETDYVGVVGVIAPSNFCYSNINNGYGAFAGVYVVETDWITKEFIENNR